MTGFRLRKRRGEWIAAHPIQATVYLGVALAGFIGVFEWLRHPDADLLLIAVLALVAGFILGGVNVLAARRTQRPKPRGSRGDQRERERRAGW